VLTALVGHVGDDDVGALTGEREGGRAADAARCAGHERDLAREGSGSVG
jgi:hypothetical protein